MSLKMSLNAASEKDRKVIKKNIKKLAKTQRQFEV